MANRTPPPARPHLQYHDTRGADRTGPPFCEVLRRGTAPGGGLYVPGGLPVLDPPAVRAWGPLSYSERARRLFDLFAADLAPEPLAASIRQAYPGRFDDPAVAPLREIEPGRFLLELWHGPTCAFKDLALQLLPRLLAETAARRAAEGGPGQHLLLTATSGDTGAAALEGFARVPGTRLAVFYPQGGVSELQRLQMVTRDAPNLLVIAVKGSFDDAQRGVRTLLADTDLATRLRTEYDTALSSANSLNWGRVLPQIVYWVGAWADLAARGALGPDQQIDVVVPTGNFGNLLAAWYARAMGVPLGRLVCASNANRVLADFLKTGRYDLAGRSLVRTPSPSMDILVSSNIERLLYHLTGDPRQVRGWMEARALTGAFEVDAPTGERLRNTFAAGWVDSDTCLRTIQRVYEASGVLLDPHTAVAWRVAEPFGDQRPVVIASTAHWAKFGPAVLRALLRLKWEDPLPDDLTEAHWAEAVARVQQLAPGVRVPAALDALVGKPELHRTACTSTADSMAGVIMEWLRSRTGKP